MLTAFNITAGVLTIFAYIPYIRSILRGETHPSKMSWWIWSGMSVLLGSTYYSMGASAGLGLLIGALIGQAAISVLAIWYGTKGITKLDWFCLCAAVAIALFWWITGNAYYSHVSTVLIDCFGWIPTFWKTLRKPESENFSSWFLWAIASVFSLFALDVWSFGAALYPLYILISDGIIALIVARNWRR